MAINRQAASAKYIEGRKSANGEGMFVWRAFGETPATGGNAAKKRNLYVPYPHRQPAAVASSAG